MSNDADIVMVEESKANSKSTSKIDGQRLLALAKDKSRDSYEQLTNEISDIYCDSNLTEKEYSLANDILLTLIKQAEIDLREALAERLSVQDNVPEELILHLAHDDIIVANHVLTNSPKLSDNDLLTLIKQYQAPHWQAIAKRKNLASAVSMGLIRTGDIDTAHNLINNKTINFNDSHMAELSRLALKSDKLHVPLLNRPEVNNDIALNLYMYVSQSLRHEILNKYNINKEQLDKTLNNLLMELHASCYDEWDVTPEMENLAQSFWQRQEISTGLLIKTLRRGQLAFFVALLSAWLDMDVPTMKASLQGDGGKSFAIACRSLGIIKSEFATIFLLSSKLHSGKNDIEQSNLLNVIQFFDKITTPDAQRVIKSWSTSSRFKESVNTDTDIK